MLKIKDNVNLKELEKYGFEELRWSYVKQRISGEEVHINIKTRRIATIGNNNSIFCGLDIIYDLIKADLVEKVGE